MLGVSREWDAVLQQQSRAPDHDGAIPSWRKLVAEVHKYDCRYIIQLHFSGRQRDIPRKEYIGVLAPSANSVGVRE